MLLLLILVFAGGCGKKNEQNRQSISGTVSLAGTPLASGLVEFTSVEATGISSGATITDGKYSIPVAKGLPPGDYLVRISSAGAETEEAPEMPGEIQLRKELIPIEYNVNSKEIRTVTTGQQNLFNFEIPAAAQ